jgi:hypothetical protein
MYIACSPAIACAHTEGESYEAVVDGYAIDIGYDPQHLKPGRLLTLDFALSEVADASTSKKALFDSVWVRVDNDTKVFLATGITRAREGGTKLLFRIPEEMEGDMNFHVRYERGGAPMAETSFPLSVDSTHTTLERVIGAMRYLFAFFLGALGYKQIRLRRMHTSRNGDSS